jgi:hypothetical protein
VDAELFKELMARLVAHLNHQCRLETYGSDRAVTKREVLDTLVEAVEGFDPEIAVDDPSYKW